MTHTCLETKCAWKRKLWSNGICLYWSWYEDTPAEGKQGWTREDLAAVSGISPKFLYEIENGKKGFSAQTLSLLAKCLHVSCDYIMFGI